MTVLELHQLIREIVQDPSYRPNLIDTDSGYDEKEPSVIVPKYDISIIGDVGTATMVDNRGELPLP